MDETRERISWYEQRTHSYMGPLRNIMDKNQKERINN
jgi:hypothetical protein